MPIITNWTSMLETNPEQIVAEDITSFFLKRAVSDSGKKLEIKKLFWVGHQSTDLYQVIFVKIPRR